MPAQDDQTMLEELAERLGLEDDEAENFISSAMSRLGYKLRRVFEDDPDNGGNRGGGDFFSQRQQRRTREIRGGRGGGRGRASGFGMGQYGD